jgi:hypothetical protein
MLKAITHLRERLNERSTWMFWIGSMGTVAAFPEPFNYIGAAMLFIAGLVPDGPVKTDAAQ